MNITLLVLIILVPILSFILLGLNVLLSTHRAYEDKLSVYECGYNAIAGQTRESFQIHFYLVAILFLIFDIELVLLLPFGISLSSGDMYGFCIAVIFLGVLTIGFVFELSQNAITIKPSNSNLPVIYNNNNLPVIYKNNNLPVIYKNNNLPVIYKNMMNNNNLNPVINNNNKNLGNKVNNMFITLFRFCIIFFNNRLCKFIYSCVYNILFLTSFLIIISLLHTFFILFGYMLSFLFVFDINLLEVILINENYLPYY